MPDPRNVHLSTRTIALLPVVLFVPSPRVGRRREPGVVWPEYIGVFFHLAILLLVSRSDAPTGPKAAGYGWITLDVLTGILTINEVADEIT